MKRQRRFFMIPLLMLVLLISACTEDGELPDITGELPDITAELPEGTRPEATVPETQPPAESAPSEAASTEDGTDEGDVPVGLLVLLGIGLVALIAFLAARAGSGKQAPPPPPVAAEPEWHQLARSTYSDARWLQDEMDEDLAMWRGETLSAPDAGAHPGHQTTWSQLDSRLDSVRQSLYRLESMTAEPDVTAAARSLGASLAATRSAVDRLAEAHSVRLSAEGNQGDATAAMAAERRAADDLATHRRALDDATIRFSSLM